MNATNKINHLKTERKTISNIVETLETEMLEADMADSRENSIVIQRWNHLCNYKRALIDHILELTKNKDMTRNYKEDINAADAWDGRKTV